MKRELWKLTWLGMKGRKKTSILMFLVLLLSFSFAVVTLSVTSSMDKTNKEYRFNTYGAWYGAFYPDGEKDITAYRKNSAIDEIGTLTCHAKISGVSGNSYIGCMDNLLQEIGRITLLDGRMPQKENEIAVEADMLSALGYDYTLGQDISIPAEYEGTSETGEADSIIIEQQYTLVGIVKEYTNLWLSGEEKKLPSVIITEEAAQNNREKALLSAKEEKLTLNTPESMCFFTVKTKMEKTVKTFFEEKGKDFIFNKAAYEDNGDTGYHLLYTCLIFVVTILAILCIYMIYLKNQTKQTALFRTIGITKRQLCTMLFYETIMLSLPAMIIGSLLGGAFTWILLSAFMKTPLADISLDIPVKMLLLMSGLWIFSVFGARLLVYIVSLKQPLVGKMYMTNRKAVTYTHLREGMIVILASIFCGVTIFSVAESVYPLQQIAYWRQVPSYLIHAQDAVSAVMSGEKPQLITEDILRAIDEVPGVGASDAAGSVNVKLSFDGMEKNELAVNFLFEDKIDTTLKIVSKENIGSYFNLEETGADNEAFWQGDSVIVVFPTDLDGNISYNEQKYKDSGLKAGDVVDLTLSGQKIKEKNLGKAQPVSEISAVVGGFACYSHGDIRQELGEFYTPYMLVASEAFFEKMLALAEDGYMCGAYVTGEPFADTQANVYTQITAGYLSTDYVVAGLCAENNLSVSNNREKYAAYMQGYIQTLILLWSSGGCIAVIMLLLIGNILAMDTQNQKRKYAILQAIGMSERQTKRVLWKKGAILGIVSTLSGWIFYGIFLCIYAVHKKTGEMTLQEAVLSQIYGRRVAGFGGSMAGFLTAGCMLCILLLFLFIKRMLWKTDISDLK